MKQFQPTEQWLAEFKNKVRQFALCADYRSGCLFAKKALRKYPKQFEIRFQYAKLLGDWADEFSPARKKKAKQESIRILRPLLRSLAGKSEALRFGVCLNYYYQREDFIGMCHYGRKLIKRKDRKGYYTLGLGASYRSLGLYRVGKSSAAVRWARTGVQAWERYGLKGEPYYFAHYSYAMALAVSGESSQALAALKYAAKLSGKRLRDDEFREVLGIIS